MGLVPIAVVTSYHKRSGLKTIQMYDLTVLRIGSLKWVSLGYSQGVSRAVILGSWPISPLSKPGMASHGLPPCHLSGSDSPSSLFTL